MVVAYHKINQYAEQAGAQGRIDPVLALWVPLLLLAALIVWMYHVLAHRPGGQPIGALERAFAAGRRARSARCFRKARAAHDQPAILPVAAASLSTPSSCS